MTRLGTWLCRKSRGETPASAMRAHPPVLLVPVFYDPTPDHASHERIQQNLSRIVADHCQPLRAVPVEPADPDDDWNWN